MLPKFSFVIPIYNEEESLRELFVRMRELLERLDGPGEVVLVNDGSRDGSYPILLDLHHLDPRFKVINLSRNFGHQTAITAGMDLARGQAIVIMDADLQDPPSVVLEMVARWQEGYDVVYAVRRARVGESWFKRSTAHLFYRLLGRLTTVEIPHDVGDFRLVDRKALDAFKSLRENNRYVRGMFAWVGFRQTAVHFDRAERFAGQTKYPLRKMLKFATDGIVSFSNVPLQIALNLGSVLSVLSFLTGLLAIGFKWTGHTIPGWTSLVVVLSFFGGAQMLVIGMMGEYIGRIYEEVKARPLYIVRDVYGMAPPGRVAGRAVLPTASDWHELAPVVMAVPRPAGESRDADPPLSHASMP